MKTVWYMIDNVSLRPKTDLKFLHNLPENEIDEFLDLSELQILSSNPM
jgi:hypothetical protein